MTSEYTMSDVVIGFIKKHFVGQVNGCDTIHDAVNRLLLDGVVDSGCCDYDELRMLHDDLKREKAELVSDQ